MGSKGACQASKTKRQNTQNEQNNQSESLEDKIFEFKMMAKSFERESSKNQIAYKKGVEKVKNLIAKGDYEKAKIAAQETIRNKNNITRYKLLSSKLSIIHQKLESAYKNQKLTDNMKQLTNTMYSFKNNMDPVKINETMNNFEQLFDNIDVNTNMMNEVFDNINDVNINDAEVNNLINDVAESNGMKIEDALPNVGNKQVYNDNIANMNAEFI